jgi:hypothetical protein
MYRGARGLEQEAGPRAPLAEASHCSIALMYKFDEAIRHFLRSEIWLDRFSWSTSGPFPALAERFDPRRADPHLCDGFVDAISSLRLGGVERPA